MPDRDESKLMAKDAPADTSTELSFMPPNGPFGDGNVVKGSIDPENPQDEDWIVIELSEGKKYTITVGEKEPAADRLHDSVLKLLDSKGGLIMENDDVAPREGNLSSKIEFTPEAGSGTQTYYLSVSGYAANPGAVNTGAYTVRVTEVVVLPVGAGADITGTDKDDKLIGTNGAEKIMGKDGDDTLDGMGGDDTLHGGPGNDLLIGGPGADTLQGGGHAYNGDGVGGDTISYQGSAMGVTINLRDGSAMGGDAEGDTLGSDIENVIGSDQDDMITGTDSLTVGNSLWGEGGMDRLYGGEGPDMLYGGPGDDMLNGGDEDDTLEGGPGADELTGGRGTDIASYKDSAAGVIVRLHSGQARGGDAEGDTWGNLEPNEVGDMTEMVPDIENLTGSAHADVLAGDGRNNVIRGGAGDDRIYGGPLGGDDTLQGQDGNDHLFGGKGKDTLHGGKGNDHLWGNNDANTYDGGEGNDVIHANAEEKKIDGGKGHDTVSFAHLKKDYLEKDDNEGVYFNLQAPILARWDGDSVPASSTFTGFSVSDIEKIVGSMGDDRLVGRDEKPDEIEGGEGDDVLIGGSGPGDILSYELFGDGVRINLGDGSAGGRQEGDTISGFEDVKGSPGRDRLTARSDARGDGNDDFEGNEGSKLWGLAGDDVLTGGPRDDTLEGGPGADELDGGHTETSAANKENVQKNTLSYERSGAGVVVDLDKLTFSGGDAEGDEIETYEYTGPEGDKDEIDVATFVNVTGSDHNDRLTGDRFGNTLAGGKGNDTLRGGAGGDTLNGGPGADMLDGGGAMGDEDWAVYRAASAGVTVNLNTNTGTGGEAMGDTLKNIELVWGSRQDDTFIASEGADIIHGDGGSDTVSYAASKQGVTVVLTGNGSTTFDADGPDDIAGNDDDNAFLAATDAIVGYWRAGGSDDGANSDRPTPVQAASGTVRSFAEGDILASIENVTGSSLDDTITGDAVANVIQGGAGKDTLMGGGGDDTIHGDAGDDIIHGDAGNDTLKGMAGSDKIRGFAGNDTIEGGAGDDELTGDGDTNDPDGGDGTAGRDTFVFAPGHGSDVITDFNAGNDGVGGDRIDLSAFDLTAAALKAVIMVRAGNTIINLEGYGGGRITLQGLSDLDLLDIEANGDTDEDNDIDTLSEFKDMNGDDAGVGDGGTDGIFIL